MAFQGSFAVERGVYNKVVDVKGEDLVGTKVRPPMGLAKEVYVLPMEGVLATKVNKRPHVLAKMLKSPGNWRCHICPVRLTGRLSYSYGSS